MIVYDCEGYDRGGKMMFGAYVHIVEVIDEIENVYSNNEDQDRMKERIIEHLKQYA